MFPVLPISPGRKSSYEICSAFFMFARHVISTWYACPRTNHSIKWPHMNESHQLVSMNISNWTTATQLQFEFRFFALYSAGGFGPRNFHWWCIDIFEDRIKYHAHAQLVFNAKWVYKFIPYSCRHQFASGQNVRVCVCAAAPNAPMFDPSNAIRSSRCHHHHHNIFNIIRGTWQSNTNCMCYANREYFATTLWLQHTILGCKTQIESKQISCVRPLEPSRGAQQYRRGF